MWYIKAAQRRKADFMICEKHKPDFLLSVALSAAFNRNSAICHSKDYMPNTHFPFIHWWGKSALLKF